MKPNASRIGSWIFPLAAVLLSTPLVHATGGTPTGSGTEADPFLLADYSDLKAVGSDTIHTPAKVYRVVADIDASPSRTENYGYGFIPICPNFGPDFTGSFHGSGHRIRGLTINTDGGMGIGLFSRIGVGGLVDSLELTDDSITGGTVPTGALAGMNIGTVNGCRSSGHVSGYLEVGGLVGYNTGSISNSSASGALTGWESSCGGLVGWNAGVVGSSNSAVRVYASSALAVGGLVGENDSLVIECSSSDSVQGRGQGVGGLVGLNLGTVRSSFSTGSVDGFPDIWAWCTGGLVGANAATATVQGSYSAGRPTVHNPRNADDSMVGGLVACSDSIHSVSNSYWDTATSGLSMTAGGGAGRSTAQMMQQANFGGWDFSSVWSIENGTTYPYFHVPGSVQTSMLDHPVRRSNSPNHWSLVGRDLTVTSPGKEIQVALHDLSGREIFSGSGTSTFHLILPAGRSLLLSLDGDGQHGIFVLPVVR